MNQSLEIELEKKEIPQEFAEEISEKIQDNKLRNLITATIFYNLQRHGGQ